MKRKLPGLVSDAAAEDFVEKADLTRYDPSGMTALRFEFARKEARVNMRLPGEPLVAVKAAAAKAGVPYQRFIRHALEQAVATTPGRRAAETARRGR